MYPYWLPKGPDYTWLRAIVNPIPKRSGKDPYVPSNYRGISLLSCLSKTYISLISERINKLCEINDILVDEQNGFRKGRSCSDHLFTLTSIIKHRISQNKSTFCEIIDMEKAFDCLDRNLLYHSLLLHCGQNTTIFLKALEIPYIQCVQVIIKYMRTFVMGQY